MLYLSITALLTAIIAVYVAIYVTNEPQTEPQTVIEVPYSAIAEPKVVRRNGPAMIFSLIKGKVKRKTQVAREAPSMTLQAPITSPETQEELEEKLNNI